MKPIFSLFAILLLWTNFSLASTKTILISDVDDTLKVSYTFGIARGLQYFRDTETRFTGMSELLLLLSRDSENFKVYYVSMAPAYLMKTTHLEFLKNGRFPEGEYYGRYDYPAASHKLETIRSILRQEKPDRVILLGDDGQTDAEVYHSISLDPEFAGTVFDQFIHVVSSSKDERGREKIHSEQVGYLTPVELAIEMKSRGLLEEKSLNYVRREILPRILAEKQNTDEVEMTFMPSIVCRSLNWRWNVPGLNERVKSFCRLP